MFLAKYPEDRRRGRVVYDLGRAYEQMEQIGRAVEVYVEFIDTADPNDRSAERIMSRLEELGGQDK